MGRAQLKHTHTANNNLGAHAHTVMLTILVPQLRLLVKCQQRVRDILQPRQQHGRAGSAAALAAVTSCCSPDIGRAARTVASAVVQLAQCHGTSAQASSCCAGGCELRAALAWAAARAVGVASRTNCAAAAMQNAARLRSSSQWPNCAHMLTATLPADSWTCSPKSPKSADEAAAAIGRVSPQRAAARSNTALHQEEEVVTGKERPSAQRTSREEPSSLSEQRHVLAVHTAVRELLRDLNSQLPGLPPLVARRDAPKARRELLQQL